MDKCQHCGTTLRPMGGESAHPNNWYCPNIRCSRFDQPKNTKDAEMTPAEALELISSRVRQTSGTSEYLRCERDALMAENRWLRAEVHRLRNGVQEEIWNLREHGYGSTNSGWLAQRLEALLREDA